MYVDLLVTDLLMEVESITAVMPRAGYNLQVSIYEIVLLPITENINLLHILHVQPDLLTLNAHVLSFQRLFCQ